MPYRVFVSHLNDDPDTQLMLDPLCAELKQAGMDVLLERTDQGDDRRAILPLTSLLVGISQPKCMNGLVGKKIVPVVRQRSTDWFQSSLSVSGVIRNQGS